MDFYPGRYYTRFRIPNLKGITGHNLSVLLHSNGLALLCIDPTHVLFTDLDIQPPQTTLGDHTVLPKERKNSCNIVFEDVWRSYVSSCDMPASIEHDEEKPRLTKKKRAHFSLCHVGTKLGALRVRKMDTFVGTHEANAFATETCQDNESLFKDVKNETQRSANVDSCISHSVERTEYPLVAGMTCHLMELNRNLLENPSWIITHPFTKGYLAILNPTFKVSQQLSHMVEHWCTEADARRSEIGEIREEIFQDAYHSKGERIARKGVSFPELEKWQLTAKRIAPEMRYFES